MADKKGVVMFYDILDQLEDFNDKDFREIIKAVINYDKNGTLPQFTGEKKIAFKFIKVDIDKNNEEYRKKCEQNKANISKRWNTKDTTEYDRIQSNIDIDIDIDIDKDIDIKKENKKEKEVFDYWNSKEIIKHEKIDNHLKAIQKALKVYTLEQIKTYIDRYETIIKDKTYFFDYKWTLTDFLNRKDGISSFADDGSKWVNYLNRESKPQKPVEQKPKYYNGSTMPMANETEEEIEFKRRVLNGVRK